MNSAATWFKRMFNLTEVEIGTIELLDEIGQLRIKNRELEAELEKTRAALRGLYNHTKNNHTIMGLNTAAEKIL